MKNNNIKANDMVENNLTIKNEEDMNMETIKLEDLHVTLEEGVEELLKLSDEELVELLRSKLSSSIDNALKYTGYSVINSYEVSQRINEYRETENIRGEQLYHNFMKTLNKYRDYFETVGTEYTKEKVDNHLRRVCILNKDGIGLLMSLTSNSDLIPLQEIYEELGGEKRDIKVIERFEDDFMRDLQYTLDAFGLQVNREYWIGDFRVDGYIEEYNIIIEYDDNHHNYPAQIKDDNIREKILTDNGYKVIRVNYKYRNSVNVGLVIKEIMKLK